MNPLPIRGRSMPMSVPSTPRDPRQDMAQITAMVADATNKALKQGLNSANEMFARVMQEQNRLAFVLDAVMQVLIEKDLISPEEIQAKVDALAEKALRERKEKGNDGSKSGEDPATAPAAGRAEDDGGGVGALAGRP